MINRHPRDWKLINKIILHVAVIGGITAIIVAFLYLNAQKNVIQTMSRQKAELLSAIIESSLFYSMKDENMVEHQSSLTELASTNDITKIRILDAQGKILRSSSEEEHGNSVNPSTLDNLNSFLSSQNPFGTYFVKKPSRIQEFRSIQNKKECFGCHDSSLKQTGILEVSIDYAPAAILLRNSQTQAIIISLVAMGTLAFIIIRLFERLINRPISKLKDKMKKAQEGDLNLELSSYKSDEIGSLTKNFDEMIGKLKEANHKVEELYNEQMVKAGHLASIGELAAGLAHEIKNPIAGMKGALEIFNQRTDESDPKKEIFTEMLIQIERINQVIQDLLIYAKPKDMKIGQVDPNECIQDAIKLAKPHINSKDIHFHFRSLERERLTHIDCNKIQEVLLNLILNSIASIEREGKIAIELKEKNKNELEIILSDNGKGIKREHLSQVFHPFFTTKKMGTGLGLSICKKIIDAHNGSIDVTSVENEGTTFTILLPVLG
ncbi:MAG: HAMP domain-containing protein [Candidatus Aminicenantes bacterium]|nr:MAG: HAMP domain-containing protein [Candidatus Aminicenantes bacterium]